VQNSFQSYQSLSSSQYINNNIDKPSKGKKSLGEVEKSYSEIQSILNTDGTSSKVIYKFLWLYPAKEIISVARYAAKADKRGNPVTLFVWLVKEKFGYEPGGSHAR